MLDVFFLCVFISEIDTESEEIRMETQDCIKALIFATFSWKFSNTTGTWNQVFVQPSPEEEVHVGEDQDPRVRAFGFNVNAKVGESKLLCYFELP